MFTYINKQPNTDSYVSQIRETLNISGEVAECGVYKGINTHFYSEYLTLQKSDKKIYAFDSFCGFPKNAIDNVDLSKFSDVNFESIKQFLESHNNIVVCKGYFSESLPKFKDLSFSCVILDCDLYESYLECLNFFYPRMSSGGIIVLDEYYSIKYPMAKESIDLFCENIIEKPEMFKIENNGWQRWRIKKI